MNSLRSATASAALATLASMVAALGLAAAPPALAPNEVGAERFRGQDRFDALCALEELRELEREVVAVVERVRPSVVYLRGEGERGGVASGTAVIISKDGLLATCGHVGRTPGRSVTARLADGTEYNGRTLGQCFDRDIDCGLVQLDVEGRELPAVALGTTDGLVAGDWIVALGYTHGLSGGSRPSLTRVGRVLAVHDTALLFDAPIDAGDSGGPSFNLRGEVVGLNSRCGGESWQNVASPIDLLVERMELLRQQREPVAPGPEVGPEVGPEAGPEADPDDGDELPDESPDLLPDEPPDPPPSAPPDGRQSRPRRNWHYPSDRGDHDKLSVERSVPLHDVVAQARSAMVRVHCQDQPVAFGVVIDAAGLAVTKASQLEPRQPIVVESADGERRAARVVARDDAADLALLRFQPLGAARRGAAPLSTVEWAVDAQIAPGSALLTPRGLEDHVSLGFAGIERRESDPDASDGPFLGVQTRRVTDEERQHAAVEGGVTIVRVVPGSAAERAGLAVGDLLLALDGVALESPDQLRRLLGRRRVGEQIPLEMAGADGAVTVQVTLGRRRDSGTPRRGNTATPISRRSSGFGPILSHDTVTEPEEMGTPVVDLEGRVVGMNIARYDRTATHAIGADRMAELCRRLVARSRRASEGARGASFGAQSPTR